MIKKIYKYMPLRMQFFKEPMLRATPISLLNDPFEANIQRHQIIDVINHWADYGRCYQPITVDDDDIYDKESDSSNTNWLNKHQANLVDSEQKRLIESFKSFGVVSFTEDYRNLLMWAHYADDHSGMVIEFSNEVTWLKENKSDEPDFFCRFGLDPFSYIQERPERVVYRQERPEFEFPSDVVEDVADSKIFDNYFFSKGDNWIYEKEHRSVLPLKYADKIIATHTPEIDEVASCYPSINVDIQNVNLFNKVGNTCDITFAPSASECIRSSISIHLSYRDKNPLFLYSVDSRFISAVYLGCRVSDSLAAEVLHTIKNSEEFDSNISVKRAKLSTGRYALEFEDIYYPMLTQI